MSTWRIEAIPLYDFVVPGPEVLFQRGFGETVAMTIYAFVLFGADKCVLVDTGLPPDIAALNADIRTRKGPEAGFEPRDRSLAEELARRAIVPDAIVVTSFGPYAVGGLSALPPVWLLASARGLRNLATLEEPALVHAVPANAAARLQTAEPIAGAREIWPGLSFVEVGVHHPASAALLIDTADGRVAIADPVFMSRNLRDGIALGAAEEASRWHGMVRMLGARADAIIPIHDPDSTPVPRAAWHACLGAYSHG